MAMLVAAKFSPEEMPRLFDPGPLQDLRPEEFVVVPRNGSEDVAFISGLEHKSVHQLKLRRDPYPRVLRRAETPEVEAWWERKTQERRALVVAKEKSVELKLDIKISHVRFDAIEGKATFHFTSEQRVDFRALVKDLSALLKLRIELWQIGVRDEARMIDGFGVCGLQTCCSTWLKEFRPITIRMAKDQDINLPPTKLSGQCGRLLCCLSYEADQYRQMGREALPKGATTKWGEKNVIIIDRNLVGNSYTIAEENGTQHHVKASDLGEGAARVPEQMKQYGRKLMEESGEAEQEVAGRAAAADPVDEMPRLVISPRELARSAVPPMAPVVDAEESDDAADEADAQAGGEVVEQPEGAPRGDRDQDRGRRRGRGGRRGNRGSGGGGGQRPGGAPPEGQSRPAHPQGQQGHPKPGRDVASDKPAGQPGGEQGRRKKKRRRH